MISIKNSHRLRNFLSMTFTIFLLCNATITPFLFLLLTKKVTEYHRDQKMAKNYSGLSVPQLRAEVSSIGLVLFNNFKSNAGEEEGNQLDQGQLPAEARLCGRSGERRLPCRSRFQKSHRRSVKLVNSTQAARFSPFRRRFLAWPSASSRSLLYFFICVSWTLNPE